MSSLRRWRIPDAELAITRVEFLRFGYEECGHRGKSKSQQIPDGPFTATDHAPMEAFATHVRNDVRTFEEASPLTHPFGITPT